MKSPNMWKLAVIPALLFLMVVVILPLGNTIWTSFAKPELGLGNYVEFFARDAYVRILVRTILTALLVTVACLLIAFPYAYLMTLVGARWRLVMVGAILIPFWTSAVVRTFAWMVLLQPSGLVNQALGLFGLGPYYLTGNLIGVLLAMTQVMLPLMILPLFSALASIDRKLLVAANGLGSPPLRAFRRVILPLTVPGIVAGSVIVFVSSLGFYLIPQLLGSPRQQLLSQLIVDEVSVRLNFGIGSAMAVVLFLATALILLSARKFGGSTETFGSTNVLSPRGAETLSGRRPVALVIFSGIVGMILVGPAMVLIPLSFTNEASFVFPPESYSLRWYANFFSSRDWIEALTNSLKIAGLVTVCATVLGVLASFGIVRSRSRFGRWAQGIILVPRIVPTVIVAVAVYAVFLVWGFTATTTGFVMAHTALAVPFVVVIVSAAVKTLDPRLEIAAQSLGSSPLRGFCRVTLPLIWPSVASGALLAFITSFDEVIISLFLQGPFLRTLPVLMFSSIQDRIDPTIAVASTLILALASILIILNLVFRKDGQNIS
ncbi:ABC transporter permease subunit [Oceaniglobus trochenteri]|uniref:ABC transporter permease subunit n=1 Tax=Oceaniglobus trochenteri TaxID=2763260 RepID=UPI001CFFD851|nr:ABC transporter permease subunit [Oceaniglobus trochenteri]